MSQEPPKPATFTDLYEVMQKKKSRAGQESGTQTTAQSSNQSTNQSSNRLDNLPINPLTNRAHPPSITGGAEEEGRQETEGSPILGKPKGFYITEQQDKALDVAVEKLAARLRGRVSQKIDRSTVLRLLLDVSNVIDDETINQLANQLINRLVKQLTG